MTKAESTHKDPHKKLYIVHGWTYGLDAWQPTVKLLKQADISPEFLKVPGLTKPSQRPWSIGDYVAWLEKELKSVDQPIVLGHSNGGRILLNYCFEHPKKIKHLILLNSAGVLPNARRRLRNCVLRNLSKLLRPLKSNASFRSLVHKIIGARDYGQAPPHMKLTLGNMLDSDKDLLAKLVEIKTPVSFIWGEKDRVTTLKEGHYLQSQLSDVKNFEILKEAAHAPYITHPHELTRAILKVLMNS